MIEVKYNVEYKDYTLYIEEYTGKSRTAYCRDKELNFDRSGWYYKTVDDLIEEFKKKVDEHLKNK